MSQTQTQEINAKNQENDVREIDLGDLFSFYFSKIIWIIIAFVVGAVIAGVITKFAITPKYTATSTMYMVSSSTGSVVDLTDLNLGTSLSSDYIELIKTRPIVESVIEDLDLDYDYKTVLGMMNISVVTGTRIIKIAITSEDPEEAMMMANRFAEKTEIQIPLLMDTPKPNIAEQAILPTTKSSPSLTRNVLIGALICLVLMLIVLTVMYLMDDTLKSAEDVEKYFGVMPLTTIPEGKIEGLESTDDRSGKGRRLKVGKKRSSRSRRK